MDDLEGKNHAAINLSSGDAHSMTPLHGQVGLASALICISDLCPESESRLSETCTIHRHHHPLSRDSALDFSSDFPVDVIFLHKITFQALDLVFFIADSSACSALSRMNTRCHPYGRTAYSAFFSRFENAM